MPPRLAAELRLVDDCQHFLEHLSPEIATLFLREMQNIDDSTESIVADSSIAGPDAPVANSFCFNALPSLQEARDGARLSWEWAVLREHAASTGDEHASVVCSIFATAATSWSWPEEVGCKTPGRVMCPQLVSLPFLEGVGPWRWRTRAVIWWTQTQNSRGLFVPPSGRLQGKRLEPRRMQGAPNPIGREVDDDGIIGELSGAHLETQ